MSARSSDSIRHIAKALAAAQRELQNPQPRHEGQIRRELPSGLALIEPYRFASLGDGLALIRPVLGRHGLSLIQATRLDGQVGLVILETRIIHESGEWILADYPVAGVLQSVGSDPRELGAALTYARRQSLFSLIGIAPQNDTDGSVASARPTDAEDVSPPKTGAIQQMDQAVGPHRDQGRAIAGDRTIFQEQQHAGEVSISTPSSAASRSSEDHLLELLRELEGLSCRNQLRTWAIDRIKLMATLLPQDRHRLNEAFLARRNSFDPQRATAPERVHQPADETVEAEAASAPAAEKRDDRNALRGSRRRAKIPPRSKAGSTETSSAAAVVVAAGGRKP